MKELESLHLTRLKEMRAREAEMKERFANREQEIERQAYAHRQRQLQDIEAIKEREKGAARSEERGERIAALQEETLKKRLEDLANREAEINRAAGRHELLVQETRNVVRTQLEMEYSERLKALEAREKLHEELADRASGPSHVELAAGRTELQQLRHELEAREHKIGLLQADLDLYRSDEGKKREEVERAGLALAQAREELTDRPISFR